MSRLGRQAPLAGLALARVAGMPSTLVTAVRCDDLSTAIDLWIEQQGELGAYRSKLEDVIHKEISRADDDTAFRHKLLTLKRDIHNNRSPAHIEYILSRLAVRPGTAAALRQWHRAFRLSQEQELICGRLFTHALARNFAHFTNAGNDETFQSAMAIVNPNLWNELQEKLPASWRPLKKQERQLYYSLLRYLTRAAGKTSPLSTLTYLVAPAQNAECAEDKSDSARSRASRCVPNLAVVPDLIKLIEETIDTEPDVLVVLNRTFVKTATNYEYKRTLETRVSRFGPVSVLRRSSDVGIAPNAVLDFAEEMARSPSGLLARELRDAMAVEFGVDLEQAARYVRLLVELDVIQLLLPEFHGQQSYWHELTAALARNPSAHSQMVSGWMYEFERLLPEIEAGTPKLRADVVKKASASYEALFASSENKTLRHAPLIYENASLPHLSVGVSVDEREALTCDLVALQRALRLYDPWVQSKALMVDLFVRANGIGGRRAGALAFFEDYAATYGASGPSNDEGLAGNDRGCLAQFPTVARLWAARSQLECRIRALEDQATGREVELPRSVMTRLPRLGRNGLLTNSFRLQKVDITQGARFVLNAVAASGTGASGRFAELLAQPSPSVLSDSSLARLRRFARSRAELLFFNGGQISNLCLQPPCNGEFDPEADRHYHSGALYRGSADNFGLRHDEKCGSLELLCPNSGMRIIPVFIGEIYPIGLPGLSQFLLHFAPPTITAFDFLMPRDLSRNAAFLRRLRFGNVVIRRASWTIPDTLVPRRTAGQSDFSFFMTLREWRKRTGFDQEVYVRFPQEFRNGAGVRNNKPIYIDFANPTFAQLFEASYARTRGGLILQECLPGWDDANITVGKNHYVGELVFEVAQWY